MAAILPIRAPTESTFPFSQPSPPAIERGAAPLPPQPMMTTISPADLLPIASPSARPPASDSPSSSAATRAKVSLAVEPAEVKAETGDHSQQEKVPEFVQPHAL